MKRFLCATLLSIGLCATACGSSDSAGSGGSGGEAGAIVPESELVEQLAAVKCDLLFACACADSFSSKETCLNQTRAELQQMQASAKELHLTYDETCAGKLIAKLTERGCDPLAACEPEVCWPYYGTTTFGGGCEPSLTRLTTTCAQGSTCWYHQTKQANCGEPCSFELYPEGTQCMGGLLCDVGLTCSEQAGGVCTPDAKAGEPCLDGAVCGEDSYCTFNDPAAPTCAAKQPNGAACSKNNECLGRLCAGGKCGDLPAICSSGDFPY
jgi:hypothetical protein